MSPPNRNQRVLTGRVTKVLGDGDSYGFIDEDIFFQQINVDKGPAKVNDRVYAECQYSENLPFQWNATKVKILKPTNHANSPKHSSSSESHASNNQTSSSLNNQQSLLSNQDMATNTMITAPMLPVSQPQPQQQFNPHHNQPSGRHDSIGHSQGTPKKLLAPTTNPGEFFNPDIRGGVAPFLGSSSDAFQQQQYQGHESVQPLINTGTKLTYTSQPGSAFVTSQFVPFIPSSALAPQAIAGGHHKAINQDQAGSSRNQNQGGFQNKNNQSRWNERDIDRNVERKGNSNNDNNRRDKSRMNDNNNRGRRGNSGNRDTNNNSSHNNNKNNSSNSNSNNNASRGCRNKDDRDRRSDIHKRPTRDDSNARSSPAPLSSALSTTSNNSSSHGKVIRRRYEPVHVPRAPLLIARMNTFDIKQRYPSSLHIPSDLKEIAININFRFDIRSIPKPICYKVEVTNKQSEDQSSKQSDLQADVTTQSVKAANQNPAQEVKMLHKYGVKVILISIPTMEEIYKQLFGQNLDSFSSDKIHPSHLNNTLSFLCTKSLSGGSSLLGAKFDPLLDGFLNGDSSVLSGQSSRPNLISTCIRCVRDQTGLDLSGCTEWKHLATFIYNQKNDYFSDSASVEYSHIFMPDVWNLLTEKFQQEFSSTKDVSNITMENVDSNKTNLEQSNSCDGEAVVSKDDSILVKKEANHQGDESSFIASNCNTKVDFDTPLDQSASMQDEKSSFDPDRLAELKVSDLKAELDRRNIKYKHGIKKAELIAKLKGLIESEDIKEKAQPIVDKSEEHENKETSDGIPVDPESKEEFTMEDSRQSCMEDKDEEDKQTSGTKRKLDDSVDEMEITNKKVDLEVVENDIPVSLVHGELKVKPRGLTTLTTVPLSQAIQPQKHDQFEFSVVTNIFKDTLVQHFSEYIFTALVEDSTDKNYTNKTTDNDDKSFKNPSKLNFEAKDSSSSNKSSSKYLVDLPIDRHMNIAFTYFDSTHVGYIFVDDLNKLFLNSGYSVSKRALMSLLGESEKFYYKSLPDPSCDVLYKFPLQFSEYLLRVEQSAQESVEIDSTNHTIEYNGIRYDMMKLVQQSIISERIRVNMVERFNKAITKSDEQLETIKRLEASQKSLSNALNIQNEEICELKRDKESFRKKYDHLRKSVETSISSLTDLMKKDD